MAEATRRYRPADLERFMADLLEAAGTPPDVAALVARQLIDANLAGHDSHGVLRIPSYLEMVDRGQLVPAARPSVLHETATTTVIDGAHGFGYTAMQFACARAAGKAREAGIAAVAVRNCGHIGRVGAWVEALAREGLIGQLTVGNLAPKSGGAAPFGGVERVLGTNPWAIGVPAAGRSPVVLDFATTAVAEGKLRVARAKGQALPAGWIVGPDGQPSTDVEDFYRGGMLLPFGGHKGSALSVIAALFGGLAGAAPDGHLSGVFLLVLNPDAFGDGAAYARAVAAAVETLHATATASGVPRVQAPGEPEQASRLVRARAIPLAAETVRQLTASATRFAVPLPEPSAERRLLGEILVEEFSLAPSWVQAALEQQGQGAGDRSAQRLGDILIARGALAAGTVQDAVRLQQADGR